MPLNQLRRYVPAIGRWWWVYNEFFEMGYAELLRRGSLVYFVLCKYANYDTQECFPSYETIMKQGGIKNRNKITQAINALEYLQLIEVSRSKGKSSNYYCLLNGSEWKELDDETISNVRRILKMSFKQYRKKYLNSIEKSI